MYRLIVKSIFWGSFISSASLAGACLVWKSFLLLPLAVVFFSISGVSVFILRPPTYNEKPDAQQSCILRGADNGDVWLFVSKKAMYTPWYNAAVKEIGSIRLITDIYIYETSRPRLLILPQHSSLSGPQIDILTQWVVDGASILVECPDSRLTGLTGLHPANEKYCCSSETFLNHEIDLEGAHCFHYFQTFAESDDGNSARIIFENNIGRGTVISLAIEYAKWARQITQGKPNQSDGCFRKKFNWDLQGLQTCDLRTDCPPSYSFKPVIDHFDQILFEYIRNKLRMPSWWYFPEAKSSAFILSFDEDWFGKKIKNFPMPTIPSTWFVVDDSDIDAESIAHIRRHKGTLNLHWNRFIAHLNKFGWHFCARTIKKQAQALRQKTKTAPEFCRIHYLRWDTDFSNLFYLMVDAGIRYDSSFGPGRGQHGYRFGTGFPYFVSDKDGHPIGIQEIPFQIHEPMGGASAGDHIKLIDQSIEKYHTCVVGLFHPYYCLRGGKSFTAYHKLLAYLNDLPVWCTELEAFADFWRCRLLSKITSSFDKNELCISLSDVKTDKMTLRLPDKNNISKILINDQAIQVDDKLVLGAGDHEIRIRYQDAEFRQACEM